MTEPDPIHSRTFRIVSTEVHDPPPAAEPQPETILETDYTRAVAIRRAALPRYPVLDLVDYLLAICGLDRGTLRELTKEEVFLACVTRLTSARGVRMLGHLGFYFLSHRATAQPVLSEEQAVDCIRIAFHAWRLPASDLRHVSCDHERWPERFPELWPAIPVGAPENLVYLQRITNEMGSFAAGHPQRRKGVFDHDDALDYVDYWVARSEDQIAEYLRDERFVAGLQAMSEGLLSFHGFIETVYGRDYVRTFHPKGYSLFQGLDGHFSALALVTVANQIANGQRTVPADLRERYPDVFRAYFPEAFGRRE